MDKKLILSSKFKLATYGLIGLGILAFAYGFITDSDRAFANLLINNYYFIALVIGATFFAAIQYITQSGWSSGFVRVPQAIANFFPVVAILMIPIFFGLHSLYHWSHADAVAHDAILQHKSPYLNVPFFIIRYVIYFAVWIGLTQLLRSFSLKEDKVGGLKYFKKSELFSKIYIFGMAFTFSMASFDWIMSIDAHWFSTIFAVKNFIMGFYHAVVLITIILILLNKLGYYPFLSKYHIKDLTKYIFILGIIWAYTWFSQYILIWYANMPEETVYYVPRTQGEFTPLFYTEFVVNWLFPFLALMSSKIASNKNIVLAICIILMLGQWIDVYMQVTVGTLGQLRIGFIEIAGFLGFVGLFALVIAKSLAKVPLVAKNHPYLDECINHH